MIDYLFLLLLLVIFLFGRRFFVYLLPSLSQRREPTTISKLVIKPVLLTHDDDAVVPAFCRGLVEKLFEIQEVDESVEYWVIGCSSSDWEQALREI